MAEWPRKNWSLVARWDPGGGVGELAINDEFIIKQASSTSIMSIASEKTAWFKPTVMLRSLLLLLL